MSEAVPGIFVTIALPAGYRSGKEFCDDCGFQLIDDPAQGWQAPVAFLHTCEKFGHAATVDFEVAVNKDWTSIPLYTSPRSGQITAAMVKAGAAAMCCRAQKLGCAAQQKDSEFSTCMMPTFMEDARNCLEAASSIPSPGATIDTRLSDAYAALRSIAEGNLGDASWQANYETIKQVALNALPEDQHGAR